MVDEIGKMELTSKRFVLRMNRQLDASSDQLMLVRQYEAFIVSRVLKAIIRVGGSITVLLITEMASDQRVRIIRLPLPLDCSVCFHLAAPCAIIHTLCW